jgi:glycerol-3-phosphate dehydrogenase
MVLYPDSFFFMSSVGNILDFGLQEEGLGKRLAHGHPFLEAEVAYCARHEYCESAVDFIARRCRIAFLDTDAAARALQRVVEILASEHKWDKSRQKQELQKAKEFLETFKSSKNAQFNDGKHN